MSARRERELCLCVFSTFSPLVSFKCCANLGNPKDAPDFLIHTHGDALGPRVLENRQTVLWRKLCLVNAPKDDVNVASSGYCPEKDVAKKQKTAGGEPRRMPIEVTTNSTQRSSYQHIFHTSDFHSNCAQRPWSKTRFGERFRSTKCTWDSTRMQSSKGHSDGFRVGNAVPHSSVTSGDEERATFFVNFMAQNGLVAQNTWTAAAAPQRRNIHEERVRESRDTGQSHSCICCDTRDSQSQKLQSRGKHIHEHGPQSSWKQT